MLYVHEIRIPVQYNSNEIDARLASGTTQPENFVDERSDAVELPSAPIHDHVVTVFAYSLLMSAEEGKMIRRIQALCEALLLSQHAIIVVVEWVHPEWSDAPVLRLDFPEMQYAFYL